MNPLDVIEAAADYSAKLAAVEHAHILGDQDGLDYLLSNVDPIDARHVANVLRSLVVSLRGGPAAIHAGSTAGDGAVPRIYPQVTHVGDNWSKKAPCA